MDPMGSTFTGHNSTPMNRHVAFICASLLSFLAMGQVAMVKQGQQFERTGKNLFGDQHNVVDGVLSGDGSALVYVQDLQVPKVVRIGADLSPADELSLKDIPFDGATWTGVGPVIVGGTMHCLLVSPGKKDAAFAIASVNDRGAPVLNGMRRIATSPLPYVNEPTNALIYRPQPDPILLNQGLHFAQNERLIASPDGSHFLLSNHSFNAKGNKQFWFACLDKDFKELWSGTQELPFPDAASRIHQISLTDDGTIHLLSYFFRCPSEEQMRDKLCHEIHFSTLTERGNTILDLLIEKDFVSTARFCEHDSGRVTMALRYGALTGVPGMVLTFDPNAPKLKPTPLVDQRAPSIRRTKLMAYGSIEPGARKTSTSRTAKVPDEIVSIHPGWDGGVVVVETFLDDAFEVPMDGAIAMRRLAGDIRVSLVGANDSIQWQTIVERAFMTTSGRSYEGVGITMDGEGIALLYDHTPKGLDAILASGMSATPTEGKSKKDKLAAPTEAGVLKRTVIGKDGTISQQGTAVMLPNGMIPCPFAVLSNDTRILVRSHDGNNGHQYTLVDPARIGE